MRPLAIAVILSLAASTAPASELSEVDQFMDKVLGQRDVNWADLDRYVFRESESFALTGGDGEVFERQDSEYVRFVRDGVLVRSPLTVNGVRVADDERRRSEEEWYDQQIQRRNEARDADSDSVATEPVATETGSPQPGTRKSGPPGTNPAEAEKSAPTRPRRHYFLELKKEPGSYVFAGRETLNGHEVVHIEYYPRRLFDDENSNSDGDSDSRDPVDDELERQLNKTSMVNLWILPEEHQILRIELLNPGFDFLPYKWLARIGELRVSMTMDQPIPGTWLASEIVGKGETNTALGSLRFDYRVRFHDYAEAGVAVETEFGDALESSTP